MAVFYRFPGIVSICLAAAVIALVAVLAYLNRTIGWKKIHPTMLQALNDLYADLDVGSEPSASPVAVTLSAGSDSAFSLELMTLRGVLGSSVPIIQQPEGQFAMVGPEESEAR